MVACSYLNVILWIINFFDWACTSLIAHIETFVNGQLEGYVLYYSLYSPCDQYNGLLYDYTALYKKVYLAVKFSFPDRYVSKNDVFTYEQVKERLNDLHVFDIGGIMISHVKNSQMQNELIQCIESTDEIPAEPRFVYAIMHDESENPFDLTTEFNEYRNGILRADKLQCCDIVAMVAYIKGLAGQKINYDKTVVKVMLDNNFDELVFNAKDIIRNKVLKTE
jgi:hypothetical protein